MTAEPGLDRRPARDRGYGWSDEQVRDLEPTHLIGTPPNDGDDEPTERRPGRIAAWFADLRFVRQSPGSLLDQIRYAKDGAYSVAAGGPWRASNVWFARLWSVPSLTVLYFLIWAFCTRLPRALVAVVMTLMFGPLLNSLPVVGWLLPDFLDMTTWWAVDEPEVCVSEVLAP